MGRSAAEQREPTSDTPDRRWVLPSRRDALLALLATVAMVGASFGANARLDAPRPLDVLGVILVALAGACLAWFRAAPVGAFVVAGAVVTLYLVLGYPYGPAQLAVVALMVAVARTRSLRTSGLVGGAVALVATGGVLSRLTGDETVAPEVVALVWASWLVIPWLLGAVLRLRAEAAARTRDELVSLVAARERMRVAGEVHDIAGHGFAVIAMQAGVALISLDDNREQTRASLEAIQSVSSRGLAELRAMLGTFHPTGAGPAVATTAASPPAAPAEVHGAADLDALLDEVGAGGLVIDRELENLGSLPPEIDHVVYRVVQEALTNVVKHAHTDHARVSVQRDGDQITVVVADDGTGGNFTAGTGLTVMGQRVGAVGGRLSASPRREGGFEVEARVPARRGGDR